MLNKLLLKIPAFLLAQCLGRVAHAQSQPTPPEDSLRHALSDGSFYNKYADLKSPKNVLWLQYAVILWRDSSIYFIRLLPLQCYKYHFNTQVKNIKFVKQAKAEVVININQHEYYVSFVHHTLTNIKTYKCFYNLWANPKHIFVLTHKSGDPAWAELFSFPNFEIVAIDCESYILAIEPETMENVKHRHEVERQKLMPK